jgi:uncharacterized Zn finger protein (UPF0148 family)
MMTAEEFAQYLWTLDSEHGGPQWIALAVKLITERDRQTRAYAQAIAERDQEARDEFGREAEQVASRSHAAGYAKAQAEIAQLRESLRAAVETARQGEALRKAEIERLKAQSKEYTRINDALIANGNAENARLTKRLEEAASLLREAPVGRFADSSVTWHARKDAFLSTPPPADSPVVARGPCPMWCSYLAIDHPGKCVPANSIEIPPDAPDPLTPVAGAPEPIVDAYPCDRCGTVRTRAEGGRIFTVCDACWGVHEPAPVAPGPLDVEARLKRLSTRLSDEIVNRQDLETEVEKLEQRLEALQSKVNRQVEALEALRQELRGRVNERAAPPAPVAEAGHAFVSTPYDSVCAYQFRHGDLYQRSCCEPREAAIHAMPKASR